MYAEEYDGEADVNAQYFGSYNDLAVHRLMLADFPRMDFYHQFFFNSRLPLPAIISTNSPNTSSSTGSSAQVSSPLSSLPSMFLHQRIVLDLGAGSGILSLWAAQAGAKYVFAFEASSLTSEILTRTVRDNQFEGIIFVVPKQIEEFQSAAELLHYLNEVIKASPSQKDKDGGMEKEGQKSKRVEGAEEKGTDAQRIHSSRSCIQSVDILVSEWMGFYLLHEGMLSSFLYAKNLLVEMRKNAGSGSHASCTLVDQQDDDGKNKKDSLTVTSHPSSFSLPLVIYPSRAEIWIAPVQLRTFCRRKFSDPWSKIPCGGPTRKGRFNFQGLAKCEEVQFFQKIPNPWIEMLTDEELLCEPQCLHRFDFSAGEKDGDGDGGLSSEKKKEGYIENQSIRHIEGKVTFDFRKSAIFARHATTYGDANHGHQETEKTENEDVFYIWGFAIWFSVEGDRLTSRSFLPEGFLSQQQHTHSTSSSGNSHVISLHTGPADSATHWKQSIVLLYRGEEQGEAVQIDSRQFLAASDEDQLGVKCELIADPSNHYRSYEISIEFF